MQLNEDNKFDILDKLRYQKGRQKYKIWQDRCDAKVIIGSEMLFSRLSYIHNNPVRKNLVENILDWKYSSAGFYSGRKSLIKIKHAREII